jgi:hypothetical protein
MKGDKPGLSGVNVGQLVDPVLEASNPIRKAANNR